MAKTDLKIKATDSQARSLTSTISYVNPSANNAQLSTLGTMINAFTTNVYDHSEKITTVNVDGEGDKQTPTLQLVRNSEVINSFSIARPPQYDSNSDTMCQLEYTGDGDLTISLTPVGCGVCFYLSPGNNVTNLGSIIRAASMPGAQAGTYNFTIYASETENYNAASFDFTVTVTA